MKLLAELVLLSLGAAIVDADAYGFDGVEYISPNTFTCMRNSGYSYYIGRAGKSNGQIDQVGIQNMRHAWGGGIPRTDAYIFPCVTCSASAASQVQKAIYALRGEGIQYQYLWFDIEKYNWPSNQTLNRQYITDMANAARNMNVDIGIYTNSNYWDFIVGLDYTNFKDYPLWYANYDGVANFSDFTPFGGWTKPSMKQYKGDVPGECSIGNIDVNWYPTK